MGSTSRECWLAEVSQLAFDDHKPRWVFARGMLLALTDDPFAAIRFADEKSAYQVCQAYGIVVREHGTERFFPRPTSHMFACGIDEGGSNA